VKKTFERKKKRKCTRKEKHNRRAYWRWLEAFFTSWQYDATEALKRKSRHLIADMIPENLI